jgi:hypothetical protein
MKCNGKSAGIPVRIIYYEDMRVFYPFQVLLPVFLLMSVLLAGCVSSGTPSPETRSSETDDSVDKAAPVSAADESADEWDLSGPAGPDPLVESSLPGDGEFHLVGMSSGFYDPEEEMARALDHAARQLAVYYGAVVVSQDYLSEQTGSTYAAGKIEIRYDERLAERLREDCIPGISRRGKDFFVTRVIYKSPDAPEIPFIEPEGEGAGRPGWLARPPRIEGYITAVGSAQARRSLAESWDQADREGMAGIAESLGAQFRSREAEIGKEGGGAFKAESYVISSERISGMYVIARWRSPDHRTYYSLVVKKKE